MKPSKGAPSSPKTKPRNTFQEDFLSTHPALQRGNGADPSVQAQAVKVLQQMHEDGELQWPQPWISDIGVEFPSWTPEDGTVLDCYLDMLGLNNRPVKETSTWAARQWRLRKANEQKEKAASI